MALALVQSIDGAGPGAATAVATFASNVTAGNKIYAIGGPYKNGGVPTETVTGVTDSQGNTYTLVRGPDDDTVHTRGYIYVATAGSTGACAVTLTCSGIPAAGGCIVGIFEVSGTGVTVEDSQASNGSTSGVVTGPTLTTAGTALGIAFQFSFATTNSSNNNSWAGSVTANGDGVASKALTGGAAVVNAFNVTASVADHWFIEALAVKEVAAGSLPGDDEAPRPPPPPASASRIAAAAAIMAASLSAGAHAEVVPFPQLLVDDQPAQLAPPPVRRPAVAPGVFDELPVTPFGIEDATASLAAPPRRLPPLPAGGLDEVVPFSSAITVDASGRYLLRNGQPFPLLTRASWFATANATNLAEWQSYIDDTAAKGYTGVLLQAIVTPSTDFPTLTTAPKNQAGDQPFQTCVTSAHAGGTNFDEYATQTAYWAWVDSLVDYAASKGVVVVLYAAYISQWGAGTANEGWGYALAEAHNTASGYAAVASYGDFLARRYLVARSNVILATWGDTDDAHITTDEKGAQQALWAAVRKVVSTAIYGGETGFPDGLLSDQSTTGWGSPITPELNYAYFDGPLNNGHPEVTGQRSWLVSGPLPAYAAEGPYFNVAGVTTESARRSRWRAFLGGMIAGVNQGTSGIWDWTTGGGVLSHLSDTTELQHSRGFLGLLRVIPWWTLQPVLDGPNGTNNLISTPIGAWDANTYVTSAWTSARDLALIYISSTGTGTQSVGVSLAQMTGLSSVRARWLDPTTGATTQDGVYAASGTHTFTTPGTNAEGTANDWLLILDFAAPDDEAPAPLPAPPPRPVPLPWGGIDELPVAAAPVGLEDDAPRAAPPPPPAPRFSVAAPPDESWFASAVDDESVLCPRRCGDYLWRAGVALAASTLATLTAPPDDLPVAAAPTLGIDEDAPAYLPPPPPPADPVGCEIAAPTEDVPPQAAPFGVDEDPPAILPAPLPRYYPQPVAPPDDTWLASAIDEGPAAPPPAPPPPTIPCVPGTVDEWVPVPVLFGIEDDAARNLVPPPLAPPPAPWAPSDELPGGTVPPTPPTPPPVAVQPPGCATAGAFELYRADAYAVASDLSEIDAVIGASDLSLVDATLSVVPLVCP